MRINPKALELLNYLADKDVPSGFCNGSESHATKLSQYIYEYTENLPILRSSTRSVCRARSEALAGAL